MEEVPVTIRLIIFGVVVCFWLVLQYKASKDD